MSKCGESFVVLKKRIADTYLFGFFPVRCKSWNCETCRRTKAAVVRRYIAQHFKTGPLYMLTFTMYHSGTAEESFKDISKAWNRWRLAATRQHGAFRYLRILEPHKNSAFPHMHVLVDKPLFSTKLVKAVTAAGFGWNFHAEPVDTATAVHYTAKYLTKGWDNLDADYCRRLTRARIVSVSRGLPAVFAHEAQWQCLRYDLPESHARYLHARALSYCTEHKASYVVSRPLLAGFIVASDVDISEEYVFDGTVKYEWQPVSPPDEPYFRGEVQLILFEPELTALLTRG
jgi:hypothetical protein